LEVDENSLLVADVLGIPKIAGIWLGQVLATFSAEKVKYNGWR